MINMGSQLRALSEELRAASDAAAPQAANGSNTVEIRETCATNL
jgi:hypothetical protein